MRRAIRDTLAWSLKTLLILLVLFLIGAFIALVGSGPGALGQGNTFDPTPVTLAATAPPRPIPPTNTAPAHPDPTGTPPPTAEASDPTPRPPGTGEEPRMEVLCAEEDARTWRCKVDVYPGRIAGLELLAVENYGNWSASFEDLGDFLHGWSVAVRWNSVPRCSVGFAELQLMEMSPPPPGARAIQLDDFPYPPSPVHSRFLVTWTDCLMIYLPVIR